MMKMLPDICRIQYGYAFDSAKFTTNNGVPLIRIRDVVRGFSETYTIEECGQEYIVHNGDILIGMDGEFNIARWNGGKAYLNQRVCRLIPTDDVDSMYLFYFMPKALKAIEDKTPFVTVKHLSAKELNKIVVPLPPIKEQKEISLTLQKTDELISLRKQQLSKLDELVKARFVEMFGEVETNSKGFVMKRMDECCKFIGGAQPDKSNFEYVKTDDNIRLIQIRDYKSDRFITYIPKALARKTCLATDIMIGRYGPPIFQILGGIEGAYNVALMKAVPTKEFHTEYFRYFLKNEKLLRYLEAFSQRTAGQDGIQIDKLNAYPCFVPPMELQEKFVAFVKKIDQSKSEIQKSLEKLETLKKALMQKYFG